MAKVLNLRTTLRRYVKPFRGGLVFKAHILVYHPTLGSRVIKKKEEVTLHHFQLSLLQLSFQQIAAEGIPGLGFRV